MRHACRILLLTLVVWAWTEEAGDALAGKTQETPCARLSNTTVDFIVPHSVGGGFDTYARLIAPFLEDALDARIVVSNKPGAGGTIGAAAIEQAAPDGGTVGILNAAGLMVKAMTGGARTPNPATDFTVLGRVMRIQQVWVTAADSPFSSMEEVLETSRERPILIAMRDVGSTSFVNAVVGAHLLGMPIRIVAGYKGTQSKNMAVLRGEVDLTVSTYETILPQIENNELKVLLQTTTEPIDDHPQLKNVPLLGGREGLAARRAHITGRGVEQAIADAAALAGLIGAGRLIVAPPDMEPALSECLEKTVLDVLHDPDFGASAAAAGRSLQVVGGTKAQAELQAVARHAQSFVPILQEALARARE